MTDYGLGTHNGEPLVMVAGGGGKYHRAGHLRNGVTFTESYAQQWWQPCRVCFPPAKA